jgi:hypothetical protein
VMVDRIIAARTRNGSTTRRARRARAARSGPIVIVGRDSYSVDRSCPARNRLGAELSAPGDLRSRCLPSCHSARRFRE